MKITPGYKATFLITALAALAFSLVVSCSSTPEKVELSESTIAEWNATVDKTISEPDRAARLKELGRQLIDVSESTEQDVEAALRMDGFVRGEQPTGIPVGVYRAGGLSAPVVPLAGA